MPSEADILAECLDALARGADASEVISRYPRHAARLASLLETAERVRSARHKLLVLPSLSATFPLVVESPSRSHRKRLPAHISGALTAATVLLMLLAPDLPLIVPIAMVSWLVSWLIFFQPPTIDHASGRDLKVKSRPPRHLLPV